MSKTIALGRILFFIIKWLFHFRLCETNWTSNFDSCIFSFGFLFHRLSVIWWKFIKNFCLIRSNSWSTNVLAGCKIRLFLRIPHPKMLFSKTFISAGWDQCHILAYITFCLIIHNQADLICLLSQWTNNWLLHDKGWPGNFWQHQ